MEPSDPLVLRSDRGAIATLTLNRPDQRNALSLAMLDALAAHLEELAHDRSIHVLVLAGDGAVFSAGHDLRELRDRPDERYRTDLFARCSQVMVALTQLPQPVIARVHGVATAAGCQLVATCDLAVAAASARFATPGVDIGLFCSTPMVAVTRSVAPKHAMELLLTGQMASAADAHRMGLVNRVVPDEDLDAAVAELAELIASKPAATVALGKATFWAQRDLPLAQAYGVASQAMVDNLALPDAAEGIGAFLAKRPAVWGPR